MLKGVYLKNRGGLGSLGLEFVLAGGLMVLLFVGW